MRYDHREVEQRIAGHAGGLRSVLPDAMADQSGVARGAELGAVEVPTLVLEAPNDPAHPPPHAVSLRDTIGTAGGRPADLATIDGMGHALEAAVVAPFTRALLPHLAKHSPQRH